MTSLIGGLAVAPIGHGDRDLLVLHGLGADHRQSLSLLPPDLARGFRIIAPNLRGHGATELPVDAAHLNIERLAIDVENVVAGVDAHDLTIIGVSLGAAIALELLSRARLRTAAVLLIRPAWHWQPSPANLDVFPRIAGLLRDKGEDRGREAFRHGRDYARIAAVSAKAADALLAQFDAPRARARRERLEALPASAPKRPARPGAPTVVVASPFDPVHPIAMAEQLAGELGASLRLLAPRYEEPDAHRNDVHREVQRLLERI